MDTLSVLVVILVAVGIVTCAALVFALAEAVKTMRSARQLLDDLDGQLVPLIEKVDVTVDAVNAELMRVDGIVSRFEEVSTRVSTTTSAVQDVVNAPLEAVNAVGSRVRQAWTAARRTRKR